MSVRRYYDPQRASKAKILVPLTIDEARVAGEALRHVGHEIFRDDPKGDRLYDAGNAVDEAIALAARQQGTES